MKIHQIVVNIVSALSVVSLVSCEKDHLFGSFNSELCTNRDSIIPPSGFSISFIDTLAKPVNVELLSFIDGQTGYALASGQHGYVDVLKTVDGGYHWSDLKVDYKNYPRSMAFISLDTGVITLHDVTGCPHQCQNLCAILRTTDGGLHWAKHEIQKFKGIIRHLTNDQNGHFIGILDFEHDETLVWSIDQGITWDTFPFTELIPVNVEDLQVFEDNIYLISEGAIQVIDLQGNLVKTMTIPEDFKYDVRILSSNQFIIAGFDSLYVTDDGFQTSRTLYNNYSKLIGYADTDNLVAILNKSYCPTDVIQSNDLIAFTESGGHTWTEGQLTTNLIYSIDACHQVEEGIYLLIDGRNVYELRKE